MPAHEENFGKLREKMDKLGRLLSKDILNLAGGENKADDFLKNWAPRNPEEKAIWSEITEKSNLETLDAVMKGGVKGSKILWGKAYTECLSRK